MRTLYPAEYAVHSEVVHLPVVILGGVSLGSIQQELVLRPKCEPVVGEDTGGVVQREYDQHHHRGQDPHPPTVLREHRPLHLQDTKNSDSAFSMDIYQPNKVPNYNQSPISTCPSCDTSSEVNFWC